IRHLRPMAVLRRETAVSQFGWTFALVSVAALVALAYAMLSSAVSALALVVALSVGIGLAWTIAGFALRSIALRREGHGPRTLIAALSTSVALMIATLVTSGAVLRTIYDLVPYDPSSLYIARFQDAQIDGLRAFLDRLSGVEGTSIITEARLHVRRIDD